MGDDDPMVKRLIAISFIFACTSAAWIILGGTVYMRTNSTDEVLRGRVQSVWGTAQTQAAPVAESGTNILLATSSDIKVDLQLEHRRKGFGIRLTRSGCWAITSF
jgi:hypothetical protein